MSKSYIKIMRYPIEQEKGLNSVKIEREPFSNKERIEYLKSLKNVKVFECVGYPTDEKIIREL